MKKNLIALLLCMMVTLSVSAPAFASNQFTDVAKQDYFYEPTIWAVEQGITTGTSETTFSPDSTCTRGQVAAFLWRLKGEPEPKAVNNPFTDVKENDYYYKAVLWAVEQGITTGTSETTFSPSENCTYAEVITFLWRAEGKPAAENVSDAAYDGTYYKDAAAWADSNNILAGSDNSFSPDKDCPRKDIVTYMYYTVLDQYNLSAEGISKNTYRNYVEIDGKLYETGFLSDNWSGFYGDPETGETYIDLDADSDMPYRGLILLAALLEGKYEIEDSDNPFIDGVINLDGSDTSLELSVDKQYISATEEVEKCTYKRNGAVLKSVKPDKGNYAVQNGIRCFNDIPKSPADLTVKGSTTLYNLNDVLAYFGYEGIHVSSDLKRQDLDGKNVLVVNRS